MTRLTLRNAASASMLSVLACTTVLAQNTPVPETATQRYENRLDACNMSTIPAPEREACIRGAGLAMDAARGGAPTNVEMESADGRATIIAPAGSRTPLSGSGTTTIDDGRATLVEPAGRAPVR
ncbi:MAG: hypothetical protein ACRYGA_05060 [Janthinobacterium lividum]